jgi:UDP-N-acetylglucosamine 2-epimerase (non-hydrolysing)
MKIAPVVRELLERGVAHLFVHTGQHYDESMSRVFFEELAMPRPDVDLGVGSQTHGRQTAQILVGIEEVFERRRPDLVVVGGDVNSTAAVALVAAKLGVPVAHIEAGLRSFDRSMPEEVNRIVTDHLSDLLFTTEESANANLEREGLGERGVHFVGNCMVDTLRRHVDSAVAREPWREFALDPAGYAVLTLHRPANVDGGEALGALLGTIQAVSRRLPVLFPVHPRTRHRLAELDLSVLGDVRLTEPLPYLTFLGLMARARLVLTDSGGIQEETTALGVPCLTLRPNTERPVTVSHGTNRVVGTEHASVVAGVEDVLAGDWPAGVQPPLWDGCAGRRTVDVIENFLSSRAA